MISEPTTEENDLELNVVIPDNWTNNFDEWTVDVSTDATLYYKTSETPLANHMWGTYSDSDAKLWNDGTALKMARDILSSGLLENKMIRMKSLIVRL